MARWTDWVIRHRKRVIAGWVAVFVLGAAATSSLGSLLTNRFSVPGSDAERGLTITKQRFHERGDGAFTLVIVPTAGTAVVDQPFRAAAAQAAQRAAAVLKGGKAGPLQTAGNGALYAQISTNLENQDAADKTPAVRRAIGSVPNGTTYLSGFPALNHDTQPIYNKDLGRGESIAVPIALIVMAFMFGTLAGMAVPIVFALISIPTTLGFVWIFAHVMDMAIYVQNIVTLIGFAIAIDYSMLVVFRFREELERQEDPLDALRTTMTTAGRATLFSGATVAVGLALLILMPLPFMRSMGVGGVLVPLVSIAASATLLPALLAVMGRKVNRLRFVPRRVLARRAEETQHGFWTWLARGIMRRPIPVFVVSAGVMIALALPATELSLTGGDNRGTPISTEAARGLKVLEDSLGPGALAPNQLVVDTGHPNGAFTPQSVAAQQRFIAAVRRDHEVVPDAVLAPALFDPRAGPPSPQVRARLQQASLVDATGRYFQVRFAGKSDSGTPAAKSLVHRARDEIIPAAGFPGTALLSGAPAFGVDFQHKAYTAFPWLVLAVLVISYLLLLRAFRSVILPLKAVLLNLLSVAATYGVLVLMFQHGLGADLLGLKTSDQIEAWIPIFLFAMLFGLSMDYEVFLLSRMREEWDKKHDNEHAVAYGLEHTGRIITAAAIIMVAAFAGFTAGSFVGLQEFGIGLSAAIILDATIVRALLVPSLMKLLGDWNWYLPERVRRTLRLRPAPRPSAGEPSPAGRRAD
jgi:uncharacterized membrane protein YdfJ with MMPL/SSD domain